ncbi:MAG: tRNA (adenosine(37)-N6)-threonylcarbamoyltransferase complex dimerization subunit type 1 TsaB [Burkholderiales bacterium]|nr:tRNA (adenosine(37)-N6)-threonylcarbamoyltransferase complex dimerization subunit type 1 TsaB [Burkholderiales bacterium]
MNLLALDTSTQWCSAALWRDGRVSVREEDAGQRHSNLIVPMLDALLREAGIALGDVQAIAFGAGPGSFTGVRIACGVAQGLALGAGIPVVPVSTLAALAQASAADRVIAAMDARIGEIYHACYVRERDAWRCVHEPGLCRADDAPAVAGTGWTGCGSAFDVHESALRARYGNALARVLPGLHPHAREVAELAAIAFRAGRAIAPDDAAPLYVRDKVAMTVDERTRRKAAQGGA